MKIAVCSYGNIINPEKTFVKNFNENNVVDNRFSIDFFIHTWKTPESDTLFENDFFKGKKVDNIKTKIIAKKISNDNILRNFHGTFNECLFSDETPNLYSMMVSAFLKLEHEIKNGFDYDVCVCVSNELDFSNKRDIRTLLNEIWETNGGPFNFKKNDDLYHEKYNTIYTYENVMGDFTPFVGISPKLFFSDSVTFDIICDFYKNLSSIHPKIFCERAKINHVFYYFIKMLKIRNWSCEGSIELIISKK